MMDGFELVKMEVVSFAQALLFLSTFPAGGQQV
jgi:hypothetical protein